MQPIVFFTSDDNLTKCSGTQNVINQFQNLNAVEQNEITDFFVYSAAHGEPGNDPDHSVSIQVDPIKYVEMDYSVSRAGDAGVAGGSLLTTYTVNELTISYPA
ncbi:MAG: hypothetical protein LBR91_01655 [Puniceicoccales bacterium]|jgi:hypothetical protein|nr:hypothetical protein [Puniceicoccales bacterium]